MHYSTAESFDDSADCHLIREDFFEKLKNLKKEDVFYTIKPAGTADFKSLGRTTAPTAINGFEYNLVYLIVPTECIPDKVIIGNTIR